VKQLPAAIHHAYVAAVAAALHPVFLVAAAISLGAFALTWLLPEVPLRRTVPAGGLGESFASPRDDSSERELERIASSLVRGERRLRFLERALSGSETDLAPAEAALLARLSRYVRPTVAEIAGDARIGADAVAALTTRLERRGLVLRDDESLALTEAGCDAFTRIVESGQAELAELCANWQRDGDPVSASVLRRVAVSVVEQIPSSERNREAT
jgi:DNA-binding MarR family transcriptional regulator